MPEKSLEEVCCEWEFEISTSFEENESFCMAIFSLDGELIYANKQIMKQFVGKPSESLLNPTFMQILSMEEPVKSYIYSGFVTFGNYSDENTSIQAQIYRKNNKVLILGSIDSQQLIEQNEIMINLNREISNLQRQLIKEKHALEKTLVKLNLVNADLTESNASKDKFFSILAHDLKNPFNIVLGFSELLMENINTYDSQQIAEQVGYIYKTTKQTYNLLEDLLLWSKSQSGKISFEPQRLIFNDVCNEVILNLLAQSNKKNISIDLEKESYAIVYADSNMLKTILRNLISNAIKFSFKNSVIRISVNQEGEKAIVTVSDKGIGISKTNQGKLWNFSEQYTTEGTNKESGTGLGLILCKDFVEKHDGQIWVESELGMGSDFKFTIPFLREL